MGWCIILFLVPLVVVVTSSQESGRWVDVEHNQIHPADDVNGTDLLLACVIFRHGDRTPDGAELDLYPDEEVKNKDIFYPYGTKALTNKGKRRGFLVGQYLRERYDGLVSRLYLPDEVSIRTTDFARTKMTALTALAALYPPPPAEQWNPSMNWQPVPYDTVPFDNDDLLYPFTCPRYQWLQNQVYKRPEVKETLENHKELFCTLSQKIGKNMTTTKDVLCLDNLFQALANVGVKTPQWASEVMPQIKEMTKLEYAYQFFDEELIRLATGVILTEIVNSTNAIVDGHLDQPKLRLYSGHENNVAALMAACRVFKPHQPKYGATFSIELRRSRSTGQFFIATVYAADAGGPEKMLTISECAGHKLCDYDTFVRLTENTRASYRQYWEQCGKRD